MSRRDLIIFLTLSFMWSISFIFYRIGVPEFGSLAFAGLRVIFAGLVMIVFLFLSPKDRIGIRKKWKVLTIVGLFSAAIPLCCSLFQRSQ